MKRIANLNTKIFLDSGDPAETKQVISLLGFLDGQTTNPSLVTKNPEIAERLKRGEKLSSEEALEFYRNTVQQISNLIPEGSVSIEVIADLNTTADEMINQGQEMYTWIPNAHLKLPTTEEGLKAAEVLLKDEMRINFTLCFTQEQAAAIYKLCENSHPGQIFISPFIGRLDDKGQNGMDFIKNCIQMKREVNSNVEVLAASIRTLEHLYASIAYGANIGTLPYKIIQDWKLQDLNVPAEDYIYQSSLNPISYKTLDFSKSWKEFDLSSELTIKGIEKFTADWESIIQK